MTKPAYVWDGVEWVPFGSIGKDGTSGTNGTNGVSNLQVVPFTMTGSLAVKSGGSRWVVPQNATITSVYAAVGTAPTGASVIVDVNVNGTTIFTTQGNRPTIVIGSNYSGVVTNMNMTSVGAGQYITVDVDQVGSTVAGADLSVFVTYVLV